MQWVSTGDIKMQKLDANDGGCWYCETDGHDAWLMSAEFDCNLHRSCLEYQINEQIGDRTELEIFAAEFGYYEEDHEHFPVREECGTPAITRGGNICVWCRVIFN